MELKNKRIAATLCLITAGAGLAFTFGPFQDHRVAAAATKKPLLVSATLSQTRDLPIEFSAHGHLVSMNQVDVRPQLTGTILGIHFKEGEDLRAGQLLFTLDASDASAQLQRSEALAAQIQAQLADARRDFSRATEMAKANFIAPSAVDTAASKVDALQAQLRAAQADIGLARVALAHTRILAPISAKAGALSVRSGSLAQTSAAAPLVTLAQLDPIGVEFSLPEQDLSPLLAARAQGPVVVTMTGPGGQVLQGQLSFINNTVNPDTGTINLKAVFPNRQQLLWPGTFAPVTVRAGFSRGAVVLPPQALLEGPSGRFVYAVGADGKVSAKPVTLLRVQQEMAVVTGLPSGERVVLEGANNLRHGMPVLVAAAAASAPVAAPPAVSPGKSSEAGK